MPKRIHLLPCPAVVYSTLQQHFFVNFYSLKCIRTLRPSILSHPATGLLPTLPPLCLYCYFYLYSLATTQRSSYVRPATSHGPSRRSGHNNSPPSLPVSPPLSPKITSKFEINFQVFCL